MADNRIYELLIMLDQDLTADEVQQNVDNIESYLKEHDAEIVRSESMGRRRLAYEVRKKRYGHYHVFYFKADGAILEELRYRFRISEQVIKFLFLVLEPKDFEVIQPVTAEEEEEEPTPEETPSTPEQTPSKPAEGSDDAAKKEAPKEEAAEEKKSDGDSASNDEEGEKKED